MDTQRAYELLQLDDNASLEQIKKQYLKLAKLYHPDRQRSSDSIDARQKILELRVAYHYLCKLKNDDSSKYKTARQPNEYELEVTFEEIFFGCTKNVRIVNKVSDLTGLETQEEQFIDVKIKPGILENTLIAFPNKGDRRYGEVAADVVFIIKVKPHQIFKRKEFDLIYTANISRDEAFGECALVIPTLNNDTLSVKMDGIMYDTLSLMGRRIIIYDTDRIIQNQGFPNPLGGKRGDLIVHFNIIDSPKTTKTALNKVEYLMNVHFSYYFEFKNFVHSTSTNTKYPFVYSDAVFQCKKLNVHLELCPNGEDAMSNDFVSIFVIVESHFKNVIQAFAIVSIINSNEKSQFIDKFQRFGWPNFIKRDCILNNANQFLTNGNLLINCKLFIKSSNILNKDSNLYFSEDLNCKIRKITHFSHKWIVENLNIFYEENRYNKFENIISRNFAHNSEKENNFFLSLFPNGDSEINKDYLTIFFNGTNPISLNHSLDVRISLLNKEKIKCYTLGRKFWKGSNELIGLPLIHKNVLLDLSNNLLPGNKLEIYCEMELIEYASFSEETQGDIQDQQAISTIKFNFGFWFSHHWTIDNFDQILNKHFSAKCIQSTRFTGRNKSNTFIAKLSKKINENFESIFILHLSNLSNATTKLIKFTCSIIDGEGNEVFSKGNGKNNNVMRFKLTNFNGKKLQILCDIYEEPKLERFQKLAICDNFNTPWAIRTLSDVKLKTGSETKIKTFSCEYKWTLVNFNQIISNSDRTDKSVVHYPGISKSNYYQIQCKIQVFSYDDTNIIFKLYIEHFDTNNLIIEFRISIIDSNGQKCITKDGTQKLSKGVDIEWSEYLQKDFLLSNGLINDDKLMILAELKGFSEPVTNLLEFPEIEIRNSLHALKEGQQSDVVFIFETGNKLYAHKNFLSSTSKVFSTMFSESTNWINRLLPNNMMRYFPLKLSINEDEIAFEEMLRYLYTGKIQSKNQLNTKLLVLADKYDLEDLKTLLKERLIEKINVNLSTSELFELLKLSNSVNADKLKNKCMNIINENIDVIMHSPELELLNPSLIQELYFNYIELIKSRKK